MNHLRGLTEHEWDLMIHTARTLSRKLFVSILYIPQWPVLLWMYVLCCSATIYDSSLCCFIFYICTALSISNSCTTDSSDHVTCQVTTGCTCKGMPSSHVHVWWRAKAGKVTHAVIGAASSVQTQQLEKLTPKFLYPLLVLQDQATYLKRKEAGAAARLDKDKKVMKACKQ